MEWRRNNIPIDLFVEVHVFFGGLLSDSLQQPDHVHMGQILENAGAQSSFLPDQIVYNLDTLVSLGLSLATRRCLHLELEPVDTEVSRVQARLVLGTEKLASFFNVTLGLPEHTGLLGDESSLDVHIVLWGVDLSFEKLNGSVDALVTSNGHSPGDNSLGIRADGDHNGVIDEIRGVQSTHSFLEPGPIQAHSRPRHWNKDGTGFGVDVTYFFLFSRLGEHPPGIAEPEFVIHGARNETAVIEKDDAGVVSLGLFKVKVFAPVGQFLLFQFSDVEVGTLDSGFELPTLLDLDVGLVEYFQMEGMDAGTNSAVILDIGLNKALELGVI